MTETFKPIVHLFVTNSSITPPCVQLVSLGNLINVGLGKFDNSIDEITRCEITLFQSGLHVGCVHCIEESPLTEDLVPAFISAAKEIHWFVNGEFLTTFGNEGCTL